MSPRKRPDEKRRRSHCARISRSGWTPLRREADRYGEIIERKNRELEAAAQLRQSQDETYRKTLADFRTNLADTLGKFESLKSVAGERQSQLSVLEITLAQEKKQAADQIASLSARLSDKEKHHRDLRVEYDGFKVAFEEEVKAGERKYNDALLKLRAAEEQKAARDKQIDALKRDGELLRAENQRRDHEAGELKAAAIKQAENERRELHASGERRTHEYAQKEKALLAEISSLRDIFNSKDLLLEKSKVQFEEARNSAERLKTMLEEERAKQAENDTARRAVLESLEDAFEAERNKREAAEAAAQSAISALREKTSEFSGQRSELEALIRSVERLKTSFEEERRKRADAEAMAEKSSLALRDKADESLEHCSEIDALRHAVERMKAAFVDERKKRVDAELLAETSHSALRESDQ